MIRYQTNLDGIKSEILTGFFVGWPSPPTPETHLKILKNSSHIVLAIDDNASKVVGFINAVSDSFYAAYLPLLEVLPEYHNRGIGGELVKRMLGQLENFYMVDLACDEDLIPFYEKFGLKKLVAMAGRRNYEKQSGE